MKKELKFETALERLQEIVNKLETGEIDLDESIKLFEEGISLVKFCSNKLDEVKHKVEILIKKEGEIIKTPFEEKKSNESMNKTDKNETEELF